MHCQWKCILFPAFSRITFTQKCTESPSGFLLCLNTWKSHLPPLTPYLSELSWLSVSQAISPTCSISLTSCCPAMLSVPKIPLKIKFFLKRLVPLHSLIFGLSPNTLNQLRQQNASDTCNVFPSTELCRCKLSNRVLII